eukprot:10316079-Karenia_brevis.AAC.1
MGHASIMRTKIAFSKAGMLSANKPIRPKDIKNKVELQGLEGKARDPFEGEIQDEGSGGSSSSKDHQR